MSYLLLSDMVSGIRSRDRVLFSWLFHRYSHTMYLIAHNVLNDHEQARDIVQESFLKLWEKSDTIEIRYSVKNYLYRTAANLAINKLKKENRRVPQHHLQMLIQDTASHGGNRVEEKEVEQYIYQVIDSLPPRCRHVFTLSRFKDMSPPDIARDLGISINTVYTHLTTAIRIIKQRLQ
jgi:RNA polymerase sigma-70 factor (family 1)